MAKRTLKPTISPSLTKTREGINLKKNDFGGIDMGRKSQPSASTSGIGISQEVTNIGGLSVSGGVSVDISPLRVSISGDPSEGSISIGGGAEIPGGILGVSGQVIVDTNTGQIIGGGIGGEALGLGVNVSSSKGAIGIEFTVQIPGTPIELSLGFGFPPDPKTPTPGTGTPGSETNWEEPILPPGRPGVSCTVVYIVKGRFTVTDKYNSEVPPYIEESTGSGSYNSITGIATVTGTYSVTQNGQPPVISTRTVEGGLSWKQGTGLDTGIDFVSAGPAKGYSGLEIEIYKRLKSLHFSHEFDTGFYIYKQELSYVVIGGDCNNSPPTSEPPPNSNSSPAAKNSFPNPPPRKQNMDECCREAIKIARKNQKYLKELMVMFGRPLDAKGDLITPIPSDAKYLGETIERIKTPIEDIASPEKETIVFDNYYQLFMYNLRQQINLDVAVDPQSFVAPEGKLQNPNYQRDSEQSLESNTQPDEDKVGNKRELEIGEDVKINSLVQQQQYLFQAVKRLEYLFPAGELADAKFDKSLIIPGGKGELQIHNLIHFSEFLVQFLNATLGNPKIPVKIEDNNALKDGKQEATFNHFSISQMLRELYKIVLENGDDINAIMETTIRDFRTNLANRIQIVQIAEMSQALIEDTGMLEDQVFIPLKLDGDPYAGKWKAGVGFEPDADLDSNTEAATEKLMRATLNNFEAQVKVIRRDKRENADTRDLLLQLAEMFIRSSAIPATKEGIEKALTAAKFKVKVDNAISRSQMKRAAAAKLSRTKKREK